MSIPSFTLLSPTSDCKWQKDSECTIQWYCEEHFTYSGRVSVGGTCRAKPLKEYKIDLYKGGEYLLTLKDSIGSVDTRYRWVIPKTLTSGSDYQVKFTEIHTDTEFTSDEFDIFQKIVIGLNESIPFQDKS